MERIAGLYKALSDPARLRILALLMRHGELCACDVEAGLHATQSKTSRHLRYLAAAGLVRDRRDGVRVLYRITDEPDEDIRGVLKGFAPFADAYQAGDERLGAWLAQRTQAGAGGATAARAG